MKKSILTLLDTLKKCLAGRFLRNRRGRLGGLSLPYPQRMVIFHSVLFLVFVQALALAAQPAAHNSPRALIQGLAGSGTGAPMTMPGAYFDTPDTDPSGKMQRGVLLHAAAGRARELKNMDRARELALGARDWLLDAAPGLAPKPASQSQCYYYLGLLAEQYAGNLLLAEQYFQQAVTINSNNTQAQQALARVQFAQNPPAAQ